MYTRTNHIYKIILWYFRKHIHTPTHTRNNYVILPILFDRQSWCAALSSSANTSAHTTRYVQAEWAGAWRELTRERALWGPPTPSPLDKWALDSTEGPCRMRKMLRRNYLFYLHYPFRPELENPDNVSISNWIRYQLRYLNLIIMRKGCTREG